MSIVGVFICNGEGRLCFYRNYANIHHSLFEDFAFAFASKARVGRQTFALHGAHRLVYLPIESLYIVLATAAASNIVEDVATLADMREAVEEVLAGRLEESAVAASYAELAFVLDDMVSLGQRNAFSRGQVAALLEMESANERLQSAILLGKEKETRRRAQDKAKGRAESPKAIPSPLPRKPSASPPRVAAPKPSRARSPPPFDPLSAEVEAVFEERLSGRISAAGEWRACEVKGALTVRVLNPELSKPALHLRGLRLPLAAVPRIPPSYDKTRWADGVLVLRENAPAPSVGAAVECLKYAFALAPGDANLPFRLITWFSEHETSLEIEFNAEQRLFAGFARVAFDFALSGARVADYNASEVVVERRGFRWVIAPLNAENAAASVVLSTNGALSASELFPVEVEIEGLSTAIEFEEANFVAFDGRKVSSKVTRSLRADKLQIGD